MTRITNASNNIVFFFFKQKTAYEILTCDWSSDVCSSDLGSAPASLIDRFSLLQCPRLLYCPSLVAAAPRFFLPNSRCGSAPSFHPAHFSLRQHPQIGRASCRERV